MADLEYYNILGVSRGASADEIRKAYKKLARENHPDAKPGDTAAAERFKKIQEAYAVLSDPEQRKLYDQFGKDFKHAGQAGPEFRWNSSGAGGMDLNDILGGLFGGGRGGFGGFQTDFESARGGRTRPPRQRRGQDLRTEIEVPFTVAAEGGLHEITLRRGDKVEHLDVHVPAGVADGGVIRLAGQGQPGERGGPAGDLLVTVRTHPHPYFRREGDNLLLDLPLTPSEAALGARVDVPTLSEGTVTMTIPPGTSSGRKLRLRGKGIVNRKTKQRGDQYVVVKIVVPRELTPEARQRYEDLQQCETESPRKNLW